MANVHLSLHYFALKRCLSPRTAEWFLPHWAEPGCGKAHVDSGTLALCDLPGPGMAAGSYCAPSLYEGAHGDSRQG